MFGQVMTKRTLWVGGSAFYGMIVAFGPTLLGEAGLASTTCGAGGSQHASCDFGWTFADDACFKLADVDGGLRKWGMLRWREFNDGDRLGSLWEALSLPHGAIVVFDGGEKVTRRKCCYPSCSAGTRSTRTVRLSNTY